MLEEDETFKPTVAHAGMKCPETFRNDIIFLACCCLVIGAATLWVSRWLTLCVIPTLVFLYAWGILWPYYFENKEYRHFREHYDEFLDFLKQNSIGYEEAKQIPMSEFNRRFGRREV